MTEPIGRRVWVSIRSLAEGADERVIDAAMEYGNWRGIDIDCAARPLFEDGDEVDRELARYKGALFKMSHEIDQTLGKALGYPAHDPEQTGGSPDEVCTGEHVPETLAAEAAGRIRNLSAAVEGGLNLISMAMHLHQYGEEAPGGYETWARFERDARAWVDHPIVRKVRGK